MKKKIFVIEDEQEMLDLLSYILTDEGYDVQPFLNGENALRTLNNTSPDLILLDLMLPGISGLEICQKLKNNPAKWNIPIIILTSRSDEFDILNGINLGCDEYMTKPFSEKILLAKIKSILNKEDRKKVLAEGIIKMGDLNIDPGQYSATVRDKVITLTPTEFKLLYFLAKNVNKVYTRTQIFESVHDEDIYSGDRSIDILIGRIRKKLDTYGKYIESIYGVGYRFTRPEN